MDQTMPDRSRYYLSLLDDADRLRELMEETAEVPRQVVEAIRQNLTTNEKREIILNSQRKV